MTDVGKLPFHRKYRPSTLADYIGNEKLKKTAIATLSRENKPQIILLQGASGCGKTTFARLLAKEYLCENRDPVRGACGVCPSCQALDDYIHTGDTGYLEHVHEIDITDQNGKKDLDGILEEVSIPAFGDQWDVFIFDECHMASKPAQNRFLKIVEEPPEYKLMIFCTTDPDMMLETLINRCQLKLEVKKPTVKELGGLLKRVCTIEEVECDVKGVNFIANRSGLTIRQALTNLEQVVTEAGDAKYESAITVFEEVSDKLIVDFYHKLIGTPDVDRNGEVKVNPDGSLVMKRDVLGYITLLHKIRTQVEFKVFLRNLIEFTERGIYIINQVNIDGVSDGEMRIYRDLFGDFSVEQMAVLISKLVEMEGSADIESRLMLLGYTGLSTDRPTQQSVSGSNLLSGIVPAANELALEKREENRNRESAKADLESEGMSLAEDMVKGSNIDVVQALFGGVDII